MKKALLLMLAVVGTCLLTIIPANAAINLNVSKIPDGLYYIVTAGNGPGYNGGNYNYEYKSAMYNEDGFVKWDAFNYDIKFLYEITGTNDGRYYVRNIKDNSYICESVSSYGANICTSKTADVAQEITLVKEGKYAIKSYSTTGTSYVYSMAANHNGSNEKNGNLSSWGTIDEAKQYGVNLWYIILPTRKDDSVGIFIINNKTSLFVTDNTEYNSGDLSTTYYTPDTMFKVSPKYESLNTDVVIVDGEQIKAVNAGKAIITATAQIDSLTFRDSLEVEVNNSIISTNSKKENLYVTDNTDFNQKVVKATISPLPAGNPKIVWSSADETIATVVDDSIIRAVGVGKTKIIATTTVAGVTISDSVEVNVSSAESGTEYVFVQTPGTLSTLIPADRKYEITSLVVSGELNGDDMSFLRQMASSSDNRGNLKNLDLYNAIVSSLYFKACKTLQTIILPQNTTSIEINAFSGCTALQSIGDLSSCISIGSYAFDRCTSLQSVGDLSSCISIGSYAFDRCTSLQSVGDLSSCTTIGSYAFNWCSALQSVGDLSSCTTIEGGAFSGCALQSVDLSNCTSIGDEAFYSCSALQSVNLSSCTSIGGSAFYSCSVLQSVDLSSCTTIEKSAFADCISLQSIDLSSCTSIGSYAFNGCTSLQSVDLSNCTSIGSFAFIRCTSLQSIDLSSCTSIGSYAFNGCTSLQSVDLSSCTTIEKSAFSNCTSLQSVDLSSCILIGDNAFNSCTSLQSIDLSSCTSIGSSAFSDCTSLQSIDLSSCTSIGSYAFNGCTSLQSVDLSSCTTIVGGVFLGCDSLQYIDLSSCTYIETQVFYESSDKIQISANTPAKLGGSIIDVNRQVVVVPAALLDTYRSADGWKDFYQNIVPDDAKLEITAEVKAEESGSGVLTAIGDKAASYVMRLTLKGSINSYDFMLFRNKMPNLHYLDLTETTIEANPYEFVTGCYTEANRLPKQAFKDFSKLIGIKLPNSITYIGISAFENCKHLREVTTYPGIVTVDECAFRQCTSLPSIAFENGLRGINERAFKYCTSLKRITLPEGLLKIGTSTYDGEIYDADYDFQTIGVFQSCALDSIILPSTITFISSGAFAYNKNLHSISLPKSLEKINAGTFSGCSSLQSIALPSKITSIGQYAFSGCASLKELRIPPMVETIGDQAFKDCPIQDVYVYVANSKDVAINQNTFSCFSTATLHVPEFAYNSYYWNTQWSQFVNIAEFSDTYDAFYTKNDLTLDSETGTIQGTPDATVHEEGGLIVNDEEKQDLGDIEIIHDGEHCASVIPQNDGNISAGRARIRIRVQANRWHFFCFPFDIDLDSLQYDGQYVWRQYDGLRRSRREGGWQDLPEGTHTLTKWRGYIFQGTTTGDLVLSVIKPEFTAKDIFSQLSVYTSDNAVDASWNFVGNPYQSYYSIDQTTYDAPITVWTGSGYEAYRPGDDDYEFSPYQAFFVQTSTDNDNVGFKADCRETYQQSQQTLAKARAWRSAQYVKPDRLLFNLELTAEGDSAYTDKTRIVFNDRRSSAYEPGCDAAKFFSAERSAEIYSTDPSGAQYSINERPVGEGKVDISVVVNRAGTYSISGARMDAPALLVDNERHTTHDLSLGAYEFSAPKGTLANRFTLVLNEDITGIDDITTRTGASISLKNGVSISGVGSEVQTRLYALDGSLVGSITGEGSISAARGIYVLRVGAMSAKVKVE